MTGRDAISRMSPTHSRCGSSSVGSSPTLGSQLALFTSYREQVNELFDELEWSQCES